MKRMIKRIISIFVIMLLIFTTSCSNQQIINYGVEVVETEEDDAIEFSFEKKIDTKPKSTVVTKKDRDFQISENIESLILNRKKEPKKIKGIYLPAYIVGKEERFNPIFENLLRIIINGIRIF